MSSRLSIYGARAFPHYHDRVTVTGLERVGARESEGAEGHVL